MRKLTQAILLCIVLFGIMGCIDSGSKGDLELTTVIFRNQDNTTSPEILVELAQTLRQQALGLMYRRHLNPEEGMLFVFPEEAMRSFWMKNTYLELDLIFIDSNKQVVSVIERAVPLTETPRVSEGPAMYVLEVLGGSARKWGIVSGSKAEF